MKQTDIKPCAVCGKGIMHDNNIAFYRLSAEHMIVDTGAIQRQHGLEMMMGGHAQLANIMGPDEDMAKTVVSFKNFLICQECASKPVIFASILEKLHCEQENNHE